MSDRVDIDKAIDMLQADSDDLLSAVVRATVDTLTDESKSTLLTQVVVAMIMDGQPEFSPTLFDLAKLHTDDPAGAAAHSFAAHTLFNLLAGPGRDLSKEMVGVLMAALQGRQDVVSNTIWF